MKFLILLCLGFFAICADTKFKTPAFVITEGEEPHRGNNRSPHVHVDYKSTDSERESSHNELLPPERKVHPLSRTRPNPRIGGLKRKYPTVWDPKNWKHKLDEHRENDEPEHETKKYPSEENQPRTEKESPKVIHYVQPEPENIHNQIDDTFKENATTHTNGHKELTIQDIDYVRKGPERTHKLLDYTKNKESAQKLFEFSYKHVTPEPKNIEKEDSSMSPLHVRPKADLKQVHFHQQANEISTIKPKIKYNNNIPPDHTKLIAMARYVMHTADWAAVGTISILPAIEKFPFVNVKSVVDGSLANSTGIPYFYMAPADFTARDLMKNSRSTVLVSLEETRYCENKKWDPEDPRCTRLMLSGKMMRLKEKSTEYKFAKAALFERHPAMATWPPDHDWFVAKLKIAQIAMVDWFGGAKYIKVRDYLAYNYTGTEMLNLLYNVQRNSVTYV